MPAEGSGGQRPFVPTRRLEETEMSGTHHQVDESRLDAITTGPLPGSRKIYVPGSIHQFLRVPMREIAQTPTQPHSAAPGAQLPPVPNPAITVYDPSGPYTDPDAKIDVRAGLAPVRADWVKN